MPLIRSIISKRCTLFTVSISLNREIISPCSYYIKKGLIYIRNKDKWPLFGAS